MNVPRIAVLCFVVQCAAAAAAQEVVPARLDPNQRILVDTICDTSEWANASRTRVTETSELLAAQDAAAPYLCLTLPAESYGTMDLYVLAAGSEAPLNLHASAQVGERTKGVTGWPEWTFGNHRHWYSPPVAVVGADVVDGRARMKFTNTKRYPDDDRATTVAPALQDAMKWLYAKNN